MHAIKAKVNVLDITNLNSTSIDEKDETNLLAFVASGSAIDPPAIASDVQEMIAKHDDDDEQNELLNSYNVLLLELIKSKKAKILDKKEHEIYALKKNIEEKKFFIDIQQLDLTKTYKVIQTRYLVLLEKFIANHEKVKNLEEQMKIPIFGKAKQLFVNPDSFLIRMSRLKD